jgi:hypothetical protein
MVADREGESETTTSNCSSVARRVCATEEEEDHGVAALSSMFVANDTLTAPCDMFNVANF